MAVYRSDPEALRLRVQALERDAQDRDDRVTPAFWRCIPADDAEALRGLRARAAEALARGPGGVADAHAALERYLGLFDAVLARLDEHEAAWRAPPDAPLGGDDPAFPFRDLGGSAPPVASALAASVWPLDRHGRLRERHLPPCAGAPFGTYEARAELRVEAAPMTIDVTGSTAEPGEVLEVRAWTTVPRGIPEIEARPETWLESMMRGLRLRRERSVGDEVFDAFFHLRCDAGVERHLLTPEVRASLLAIARVDVPSLEVLPPVASVRWCYTPTAATVAAAARCLLAIRRASPLPLLKPRGKAR